MKTYLLREGRRRWRLFDARVAEVVPVAVPVAPPTTGTSVLKGFFHEGRLPVIAIMGAKEMWQEGVEEMIDVVLTRGRQAIRALQRSRPQNHAASEQSSKIVKKKQNFGRSLA
jgi:hypothetical protein